MGNQPVSCCNCNKDGSQKDSQIDYGDTKDNVPYGSQRSQRKNGVASGRKNIYAPVKMNSNRNAFDTSIIEDGNK